MILYWPSESVTPVRLFSISAGLAASTVTPGRTAPLVSLTTPAIALCAVARAGSATIDDTNMRIRAVRGQADMLPPSNTTRDGTAVHEVTVSEPRRVSVAVAHLSRAP